MNAIFISQCQKKALNRTCKVLDAYANRIGDNAWQTAITEEGLAMVRKLLRQTASKNTAVACHGIKTRNRTELEWIVGSNSKFNELGFVPVNYTEKAVFMDLPIETKDILANTHGQPLSQHLFAVGYLAYQLVLKFNINHTNLAQSAFIAGILHDIGKLDPKFQEWVIKGHKKNNKNSDDEIVLLDDGFHIEEGKFNFKKISPSSRNIMVIGKLSIERYCWCISKTNISLSGKYNLSRYLLASHSPLSYQRRKIF